MNSPPQPGSAAAGSAGNAPPTSEQRLRAVFEDIDNIAVQGYDIERRVVVWNSASERLYGHTRDEALGRRLEELIIPEPMREEVIALHRDWVQFGRPIPAGEIELLHKDGHLLPVFSSHVLLKNEQDRPEMYCVDVDLRPQREAQRELRLAAQVFEHSGEAILILDAERRAVAANAAFKRIMGYRAEQIDELGIDSLIEQRAGAADLATVWAAVRDSGHWEGEVWSRRASGESLAEWLRISAVCDDGGRPSHYVAIFADLTERRAMEAKLAYLAHHDALTGLPNRVLVRDRLQQALAFSAREKLQVALMFLDLDHFKIINDTLGHAVGDRLLQAVVARLSACVRDSDTISRQGGDEFLIVLPGLHGAESASQVAQKILDAMTPGFELDGHALTCSFSIGIAMHPDDGADFDALLLKADTAMYAAKEAGRNTYRFFAARMNADAHDRLLLQGHLRHAIGRGEFELHYQPQVDLVSGTITGAEALLRWHSPELGKVPPDRFIPVAESSGQIVPIGEWVLREACLQACRWRAEGLALRTIAVNVSALQFRRNDPVELVARILTETGLPASCLELELTESLLLEDPAGRTLDTLRGLKALGVRLAIDDFGTGYSSLAYLRRFPIDKLKIDQAFVRDIGADAEDAAIVRLIIELGRILRLETIAEGVETHEQLDFLLAHGCTRVQGYLCARPMPAHEFRTHFLLQASSSLGEECTAETLK